MQLFHRTPIVSLHAPSGCAESGLVCMRTPLSGTLMSVLPELALSVAAIASVTDAQLARIPAECEGRSVSSVSPRE